MVVNTFLKKFRFHPTGKKVLVKDLRELIAEVKSEGSKVGNYNILNRMDIHKADRKLYKFLHRKLTVNVKAALAMPCQPGQGSNYTESSIQRWTPTTQSASTPYLLMCAGLRS